MGYTPASAGVPTVMNNIGQITYPHLTIWNFQGGCVIDLYDLYDTLVYMICMTFYDLYDLYDLCDVYDLCDLSLMLLGESRNLHDPGVAHVSLCWNCTTYSSLTNIVLEPQIEMYIRVRVNDLHSIS